MTASPQAQDRTRTFARVIGPFLAIIGITAAVRGPGMKTLVSNLEANGSWTWTFGAFTLLLGLIVVALHPYWRGAAAIIVSVLGWTAVLRGTLLLACPKFVFSVAHHVVDGAATLRTVFVVVAVVSLYLTYVGWFPRRVTSR